MIDILKAILRFDAAFTGNLFGNADDTMHQRDIVTNVLLDITDMSSHEVGILINEMQVNTDYHINVIRNPGRLYVLKDIGFTFS